VKERTVNIKEITMATLQYRGVEFDSGSAVEATSIVAQYRGASYNTEDVEKVQKHCEGKYRGVNWTK
jgi:hypothetical protein